MTAASGQSSASQRPSSDAAIEPLRRPSGLPIHPPTRTGRGTIHHPRKSHFDLSRCVDPAGRPCVSIVC
jgi:hypothetical protein